MEELTQRWVDYTPFMIGYLAYCNRALRFSETTHLTSKQVESAIKQVHRTLNGMSPFTWYQYGTTIAFPAILVLGLETLLK